jgi:hypothetical protein
MLKSYQDLGGEKTRKKNLKWGNGARRNFITRIVHYIMSKVISLENEIK